MAACSGRNVLQFCRMRWLVAGGAVCSAGGLMAYAVRGRSCAWLAPSVYCGSAARKSVALTFDDGPSEGTGKLLDILGKLGTPGEPFSSVE